MTELDTADRWHPDDQLIPAVLAGGPQRMADLGPADRAWVVAGLRLKGHTAEAIADRLACSLRLVRSVSAEPITAVAMLYMREVEAFTDTYRMTDMEVQRLSRALADTAAERDRYKDQLDRMIDRMMTGEAVPTFGKCGHPRTRYNTYTAPKTGKESCRMCHADAQAAYRERVKAAGAGYTMAAEVVTDGSTQGQGQDNHAALSAREQKAGHSPGSVAR